MQAVVGYTSSMCELSPTFACHLHDTPAIHTHNIAQGLHGIVFAGYVVNHHIHIYYLYMVLDIGRLYLTAFWEYLDLFLPIYLHWD